MPIRMVRSHFSDKVNGWTGPGWAPRAFCDACGKIIDDAMEANVVWASPISAEDTRDAAPAEIFFVHKDACDRALQAQQAADDRTILWTDLLDFPLEFANASTPNGRHPEFGALVKRTRLHPRFKPELDELRGPSCE